MARQLRIEFERAYYHILSRGNNQSNIFHNDEDRQDFLYILAESERFEIEIYAYVLMDNHLLLRTMRPNLSKSMQWLGTRYTRRFNLRNLQSGHLFQGWFKSIIMGRSGGRSLVYKFLFFRQDEPSKAGNLKGDICSERS